MSKPLHLSLPVPVVIVASMGKNTRAIGHKNGLLWHVPEDLKRFKALTTGKPVIIGRNTFTSILTILGKPLPNRTNIVVTRNHDFAYEGVLVAHSLAEAFSLALKENPTEIHIGGGETLYTEALPYVSRIHLTLFADDTVGDAYFPYFETEFVVTNESPVQEHNGLSYQWVDYERNLK